MLAWQRERGRGHGRENTVILYHATQTHVPMSNPTICLSFQSVNFEVHRGIFATDSLSLSLSLSTFPILTESSAMCLWSKVHFDWDPNWGTWLESYLPSTVFLSEIPIILTWDPEPDPTYVTDERTAAVIIFAVLQSLSNVMKYLRIEWKLEAYTHFCKSEGVIVTAVVCIRIIK